MAALRHHEGLSIRPRENTIVIDYKITNTGTGAVPNLSTGSHARSAQRAQFFRAAHDQARFSEATGQGQQAQGYTWYDNTTHVMGMGESKAADVLGGFIAQVAPHEGRSPLHQSVQGHHHRQRPPGRLSAPMRMFMSVAHDCLPPITTYELRIHLRLRT